MTAILQRSGFDAGALAASRKYCGELTKRAARNFYYGLRLLPEEKREAMYALYAYMRLVDDIADDDGDGRTVEERRGELDQWEELTRRAVAGEHRRDANAGEHRQDADATGVWPAFGEMVARYGVPGKVFEDMIAGQRQDLEPGGGVAMADFGALYEYCYRVASVVGVASLHVFGFEGGEETLKLGAQRGVAFQLTNILRDLREDAAPPRGRCYLPAEDLARFGVTVEALARGEDRAGFRDLMAFQVGRTREFYDGSAALEGRVATDARPTLAAMTGIYRGILEKIAAQPEGVLRGRVRLSRWAKLRIGWRAMWGG